MGPHMDAAAFTGGGVHAALLRQLDEPLERVAGLLERAELPRSASVSETPSSPAAAAPWRGATRTLATLFASVDKNLASGLPLHGVREGTRGRGRARAATLWIIAGICVIPAVGSVDRACPSGHRRGASRREAKRWARVRDRSAACCTR